MTILSYWVWGGGTWEITLFRWEWDTVLALFFPQPNNTRLSPPLLMWDEKNKIKEAMKKKKIAENIVSNKCTIRKCNWNFFSPDLKASWNVPCFSIQVSCLMRSIFILLLSLLSFSFSSLFPGDEEGRNGSDRPPGPVHPFHPKITIRRGILATECSDVMQQFFQLRRKHKKTESSHHLPISNHPSKFLSKLHHIFNFMFCL